MMTGSFSENRSVVEKVFEYVKTGHKKHFSLIFFFLLLLFLTHSLGFWQST